VSGAGRIIAGIDVLLVFGVISAQAGIWFCFALARHFSERWNPAFVWLVIPAEAGIQGLCALARHSSGSWNPAFALAFDSF